MKIGIILLALSLLLACGGQSKEGIQSQVKTMLQSELDSKEAFQKYRMTVDSVLLVSSGGNNYEGIAKVNLGTKQYDVPLTVTRDANSIIFQTKPMAFNFLIQYELEKAQQ